MDIAKTIDTLIAAKLENLNYARAFLALSDCNKQMIKLNDLATFLGGTKTLASNAVAQLATLGYIRSNRWPDDKRHLEITTTQKGKDLAGKLSQ